MPAGEPHVLHATVVGGRPGEAFGLIAYLPHLDETGQIVSIARTSIEGIEAAAEVLLNEGCFKALVRRLNVTGGAPIPYFEAVIRAASIGGAGSAPEIVAARLRPSKDWPDTVHSSGKLENG